jgi:hypothetical protein
MKSSIALLMWLVPVSAVAADKPAAGATLSAEALTQYRDAVAKVTAGAHGPATEVLNGLAAQYPRVPEIFATRCTAQLGLSHFPAAEADCAYALAVRPNLPSAMYGLAIAQDKQGKVELAVGHYRKYATLEDPQATFKPQALARANALESQALPVPPPPPPTGDAYAGAPPQASGAPATLLVYRNHFLPARRAGGRQQVSLYLDGRVVGEIAHDQFVEIQTGAGSHLLEARFAVDHIFEVPRVLSIPVELGANGQSYVNFDYQGGQLMLLAVPPEKGRKEIQEDCKKAYTRKM